jgi:hypothetical protein
VTHFLSMVFRLLQIASDQVKLIWPAPTRKDFEAARVASGGFVLCLMRRIECEISYSANTKPPLVHFVAYYV